MHATLEKGWLAGLVSKDVLESVCVCVGADRTQALINREPQKTWPFQSL